MHDTMHVDHNNIDIIIAIACIMQGGTEHFLAIIRQLAIMLLLAISIYKKK